MPKTPTRKRTLPSRRRGAHRSPRKSPTGAAPAARGGAAAIETLRQQADQLGLLDPLDAEPATVYSADESDT